MSIETRLLAGFVLAVALGAAILHYRDLSKRAEAGDAAERAAGVATVGLADGQKAAAELQQVEVRVTVAREDSQRELIRIEQGNPAIADRGNQRVPIELRELACRRRHAREGTVAQCADSGPPADASER